MNDTSNYGLLRAEIAAAAARMIVEDGIDYGAAKRKSARQLLGHDRARRELLPDNAQIEDEVRLYNQLFLADRQPARLRALRELAVELMEQLASFRPYLVGAVQNGTAGQHSDIHLQLFPDNPKEVAFFLLDQQIRFETSESAAAAPHLPPIETLSFIWRGEGVHLALHGANDLRTGKKARQRADLTAARRLCSEQT